MLFTCPKCGSKARFASSKQIDKETREGYWQCMNLNCGTVFVTHTLVSKVVEPMKRKHSPERQIKPYNTGGSNQVDMFIQSVY
ncbi:ogr/Delta-like zinc finger family protein [Vibrio fluvialis]|nr:ogr/Delta-like zinc finger family protein [Vibrio fluvialis]